jgi:alkanesulfonate monooxygenase SsuD/methylene tetrahydromethanopterin reductase-like flavin-dependent oxidoreductase (luciferase family)
MRAMRPFRFLGIAAADLVDGPRLAEAARRAESIGYSALVVPDHLIGQHAPIPVLAMVAAATERLRIGRSCPMSTFAIRPCWPRTSPASTC